MVPSRWFRVIFAACLFVLPSLAMGEEAVLTRQHGEWLSGALLGPRPTRFRFLAEQIDAGSYTTFAIDVLEADCRKRFATLNVHLQEAFPQDLLSEGLAGSVRVDRHPMRRVVYRVGAQAGARMLFIFLVEIEGEDDFWKQVAAGQSVRFRFPTERKDYHLRFALRGFVEAQKRAFALCRSPTSEEDRSYFKN